MGWKFNNIGADLTVSTRSVSHKKKFVTNIIKKLIVNMMIYTKYTSMLFLKWHGKKNFKGEKIMFLFHNTTNGHFLLFIQIYLPFVSFQCRKIVCLVTMIYGMAFLIFCVQEMSFKDMYFPVFSKLRYIFININ